MFDMIKFATKAAIADRKGITAIEYALIASAVVAVVIAGYKTMFGNLKTFVEGVSFS